MPKIKLTIQELKRQKADLERYRRFLPTLLLKKMQLQMAFNNINTTLKQKEKKEEDFLQELDKWIAVMGEDCGISDLVVIEKVEAILSSVAGVEIPVMRQVRFKDVDYDLYTTPPWIDHAVAELRTLLHLRAEIMLLEKQVVILKDALQTAVQRVNLFENIKIPETLQNIRTIQVFLGDQQTAAVVRGKLSKAKRTQDH